MGIVDKTKIVVDYAVTSGMRMHSGMYIEVPGMSITVPPLTGGELAIERSCNPAGSAPRRKTCCDAETYPGTER